MAYGCCLTRLQRFAIVNNCPDRVHSADPGQYFTTFHEMLADCLPDGTPNLLLADLGMGAVDALLDLMFYAKVQCQE